MSDFGPRAILLSIVLVAVSVVLWRNPRFEGIRMPPLVGRMLALVTLACAIGLLVAAFVE